MHQTETWIEGKFMKQWRRTWGMSELDWGLQYEMHAVKCLLWKEDEALFRLASNFDKNSD